MDEDSDETTNSSRKKSLRSSSSKTETVYKKKQKTSPLDKHFDDVNDEPDTTSGKCTYHLLIIDPFFKLRLYSSSKFLLKTICQHYTKCSMSQAWY